MTLFSGPAAGRAHRAARTRAGPCSKAWSRARSQRHDHAPRLRDRCATSRWPTCAVLPLMDMVLLSACTARWWPTATTIAKATCWRACAIVGPDVVVGAELDPHNHLTPEMVAHADLMIAFKEYRTPSVLERGLEVVDICAAQVEGKAKPCTRGRLRDGRHGLHLAPARAVSSTASASLEGRMASVDLDYAQLPRGRRARDGHQGAGPPPTATRPRPMRVARQLADELIAMRDGLAVNYPSIDASLDQALAFDAQPPMVVLADGADNPGGGAASAHLHPAPHGRTRHHERALARTDRGTRSRCASPSMPAWARSSCCASAREISPLSGDPIDLNCTVEGAPSNDLGDDRPRGHAHADGRLRIGRSRRHRDRARSRCATRRWAPTCFTQLGCDLAAKKIIVVKSSQHFTASGLPRSRTARDLRGRAGRGHRSISAPSLQQGPAARGRSAPP